MLSKVLIGSIMSTFILINMQQTYADNGFITNQELENDCKLIIKPPQDAMETFQIGKCIGFILGMDGLLAIEDLTKNRRTVCKPENITIGQVARIFLKWTNKNPEKLHQVAVIGLLEAELEAFPCPRTH
jgi:hypothetical protein